MTAGKPNLISRTAVSLLLAVLLSSCEDGGNSVKLPVGKEHPSFTLEGFRLVETVSGRVTWEFQAKTAYIYEKKNRAYAERVRILGYAEERLVSELTADKGTVDTSTNAADVEGHVVLMGKNRTRLKTERLSWDPRNRRISSRDDVTITYRDGNVLQGTGFTASANLEDIRIISPKGRIRSVKDFQEIQSP
jgi:LPS export ABC transporter protein LptC